MIKFNDPYIRPFKIDFPPSKGGEDQPYLHGSYKDASKMLYEILFPYEVCTPWSVMPGILAYSLPPFKTAPGTSIMFVSHPKGPRVIPTSYQTDWWGGYLDIWFAESELNFKRSEPIALAVVVKRVDARTEEMNEEEKIQQTEFVNYLDKNRQNIVTRNNNLYERCCWLAECGKLTIKPKKKYKLI